MPARRSMAMDGRARAGAIALVAIGFVVIGAFAGLVAEAAREPAGALSAFDATMVRVARFTLWQAGLSTILSVAPAIVVARAINRHPTFPGRSLVMGLFALPLALPAVVAALAVLALFGRAGLIADASAMLDLGRWPGVYGLSGILLAHVFFNLPLAVRLLVEALATVPADHRRLASQLGMGVWSTFRFVEWPAIRRSLPGVAGLAFMLCVTSFTIVLMLGGGPAATTLEVAIYQSLRFDFDPARAVALAFVQLVLTLVVLTSLNRIGMSAAAGFSALPIAPRRALPVRPAEAVVNGIAIAASALFVGGPVVAMILSGLGADLARLVADPAFHRATATSLAIAAAAAAIAVALSLALAWGRRSFERQRRTTRPAFLEWMMGSGAVSVLVLPPLLLGAGWFVLLRGSGDVFALAPVMVVAVNAIMAMPFAIRIIRPAVDASSLRHDRLASSLGIRRRARWRLIDWPALRRPVVTALAFAMALSLGDLGVIALFGSDALQTLPYLLYARLGSYRTADAAGLALLLGLICLALVLFADRFGRDRTS